MQGSHLGHYVAKEKDDGGCSRKWIDSKALGRQNLQDLVGEREKEKSGEGSRAPGLQMTTIKQ